MLLFIDIAIGVAIIAVLVLVFNTRAVSSLFVRAKVAANEAAEKLRDPVAEAQEALAKLKEEKQKISALHRKVLLHIKGREDEIALHQHELDKYERLAVEAGKAGNREDVIQALEFKKREEEDIALLKADIANNQKLADEINNKKSDLGRQLVEAEKDRKYLASSLQFSNFREEISGQLSQFGDPENSALARLRTDAAKAKNRADLAEAEAHSGSAEKSLEQKYAPATAVTDDELAKYLSTNS